MKYFVSQLKHMFLIRSATMFLIRSATINLSFMAIFTKGNNFVTSCLLLFLTKPFQNEVYSKSLDFVPSGPNSSRSNNFPNQQKTHNQMPRQFEDLKYFLVLFLSNSMAFDIPNHDSRSLH